MAQPKVNRKLANLGADLTSSNMTEGYAMQSKSKNNSPLCGAGENNLILLWTIPSDDNKEALDGAAATVNLLSPSINNSSSMNPSQNSARMTFYYHHKENHFLHYLDDPNLDDAVIYMSGIPFQYNEREGKYAKFIGNLPGTISVATKRDHKFLLSQKSSNLTCQVIQCSFRQLYLTENYSDLTQIAPANTGDMTHHMYNAQKRYVYIETWVELKWHLGAMWVA